MSSTIDREGAHFYTDCMQRSRAQKNHVFSLYKAFSPLLFCALIVTALFTQTVSPKRAAEFPHAQTALFAPVTRALEAPFSENAPNVTRSLTVNAKTAMSAQSDTYRFCVLILIRAFLLLILGACVRFFTQKAFLHDINAFITHTLFLQTVK